MSDVQVLSEGQFRAATRGEVPELENVYRRHDGSELWSVPVPMPSELLDYTLSTVAVTAEGSLVIVDPGWAGSETLEHLERAFSEMGRSLRDTSHIIATHAHPDHLGAAAEIRHRSGASIMMHEREQAALDRAAHAAAQGGVDMAPIVRGWGAPSDHQDRLPALAAAIGAGFDFDVSADVLLHDGDSLPIPGIEWEVIWTPGHTAGHICLVDVSHKILISGDHVVPTLFPGVGIGVDWGLRAPGDSSPIADALASLDKLAPFDEYEVIPGHGYRFSGLGARRLDARAHIVARAREVRAAIANEPARSIWALASELSWSAGWERLTRSTMLPSALLQVSMYVDFVRGGGLESEGVDG